MAPEYERLTAMTDEELQAKYDSIGESTVVGLAFWLDEINRRVSRRATEAALASAAASNRLTRWNMVLAAIAAIATVVTIFSPLLFGSSSAGSSSQGGGSGVVVSGGMTPDKATPESPASMTTYFMVGQGDDRTMLTNTVLRHVPVKGQGVVFKNEAYLIDQVIWLLDDDPGDPPTLQVHLVPDDSW